MRSLASIIYMNQAITDGYLYVICKETFINIPDVIYTNRDFYLLDVLNDKIEILKAAGLVELWHSHDIDKRLLHTKSSNVLKTLKLNQFYGCFCILLCGNFLSFFVFLSELLVYK